MFDRLFRRAERKIDSVVAKYVRRVIVAVPLLLAVLFATAAVSVKLVELYGPVNGYAMMAAGFTGLAAVIALFALTGRSTPVEQAEAAAARAEDETKATTAGESALFPPELLSLITAAAPVALPGVARIAARNLPMLVALAIIGYLFARYGQKLDPDSSASSDPVPDSQDAPSTSSVSQPSATMAARAAAA